MLFQAIISTVRLYLNLGSTWDRRWIWYEWCYRCRINRSTCWPAVQCASTVPCLPPSSSSTRISVTLFMKSFGVGEFSCLEDITVNKLDCFAHNVICPVCKCCPVIRSALGDNSVTQWPWGMSHGNTGSFFTWGNPGKSFCGCLAGMEWNEWCFCRRFCTCKAIRPGATCLVGYGWSSFSSFQG